MLRCPPSITVTMAPVVLPVLAEIGVKGPQPGPLEPVVERREPELELEIEVEELLVVPAVELDALADNVVPLAADEVEPPEDDEEVEGAPPLQAAETATAIIETHLM